jgi:hypothetical protein
MGLPISARAALSDEQLAALAREIEPLASLADVIRWGLARRPEAIIAAVVIQDEYSHDVVIPWEGTYLVFDTT